MANVAIKSISNHLWYLTEELAFLSLFDETLPNALRRGMVKKLLTCTRPKIIPPTKPGFLVINPDEMYYPNHLKFFVSPKSWLLFILLNVDTEMGSDTLKNKKTLLNFKFFLVFFSFLF